MLYATEEKTVLVVAKTICGAETTYYLGAHNFRNREVELLRKVLHFLESETGVEFPDNSGGYDFAANTGTIIPPSEAEAVIRKADVQTFLGPDVIASIRQLTDTRKKIAVWRAKPEKGKAKSYTDAFVPLANTYGKMQMKLYNALTKKFPIRAEETGADCS